MNQLHRIMIWLRRMPHCRGFGVQSPSAYRFIRYVISEHYPYYAYEELQGEFPGLDWLERKRLKLYFRIANFRRADTLLDYSPDSFRLERYVRRGCNATQVVNVAGCQTVDVSHTMQYVRICPIAGCDEFLDAVLCHSDDSTLLIVEDIATSPVAQRMWQRLVTDTRVSVSFDLYYVGIAFFDVKRHKMNYVVNF